MMTTLEVRRGALADASLLAALEEVCAHAPMSQASLIEELQHADRAYFIALDDTEPVGYVGVAVLAGEGHIMTIGVLAAKRRRGIATQLMHAATAWLALRGVSDLTLEVRSDNAAAQALYESWGFVAEGIRPRYYQDVTDAVIMWKRGS